MQRAVFILSTLGPGFRKVYFRAPDPPDPSGRSAQTHKTYVVSPKHWLHVDGADKCGSSVQSLYWNEVRVLYSSFHPSIPQLSLLSISYLLTALHLLSFSITLSHILQLLCLQGVVYTVVFLRGGWLQTPLTSCSILIFYTLLPSIRWERNEAFTVGLSNKTINYRIVINFLSISIYNMFNIYIYIDNRLDHRI